MREAIEIIKEGQEKLNQFGAKAEFIIENVQQPDEIEKVEKELNITFPSDYKAFITQHGLLSFQEVGCRVMNAMLNIEEVLSHTKDLRLDVADVFGFGKEIIDNIFPFQYLLAEDVQEYYTFRLHPTTNELYIYRFDEDWESLNDGNPRVLASSFTAHIEKFVEGEVNQLT